MNNSRKFKSPKTILPPSQFISMYDKNSVLIAWDKVFELITQNELVKSYTSIARNYLAKGNQAQYTSNKSKSGAITPAAQCQGGHSTTNIQALTGITMVDLDHLPDTEAVNKAIKLIKADPHTFMAYITTSGVGIRIFAPYEASEPEVAYLDAWRWVNEYYKMLTGFEYDQATKDASRFSYLCHDPECYYNPQAKKFYIDNSPHEIESTTTDAPQNDPIAKTEEILAKQGMHFEQGQRHHFLLNAAFLLNKMGLDRQEVISHYATLHDDPQEVEKTINWAYDRATADHGTWKVYKPTTSKNQKSTKPTTENTEEKASSTPKKQKSAKANIKEIREWIDANEALRYNELSNTVERYVDKKWTPVTDRTVNAMWEDACNALNRSIAITDFQNILKSDYTKNFNPIQDFFKNLEPWQPGDTDYLSELMSHVHTTTDDIFRKQFPKWFVSMIASWLNQGVTNQTILTFIGPQGCYKSTFMRNLLPPELNDYFLVKGNATYLSKDDKIAAGRYLLIALEEIDALKPTDLNAIKALVTTEVIDERAAYARNRDRLYHIASFCATGNNSEFLTDLTGNRRWLPFLIKSIDNPYDNPINYKGLYSQLYHLYQNKFRYWNTPAEDRKLAQHLSQFCAPSLEKELIQQHFKKPEKYKSAQFLTATEIKIRCEAGTRFILNIAQISQTLKNLGYTQHIRHGSKGYLVRERPYDEANTATYTLAQEILNEEEKKEESTQAPQKEENHESPQKEENPQSQEPQQLKLIEINPNLQTLNNILNPKS